MSRLAVPAACPIVGVPALLPLPTGLACTVRRHYGHRADGKPARAVALRPAVDVRPHGSTELIKEVR